MLGDLIRLDIDRVAVEPEASYRMGGVYNEGQGVFTRDMIRGTETSYSHLHRLHADAVVMRKLTGWEGSIGVVRSTHAGLFVSTEFPTFTIAADHLMPGYMALVCQWPPFWEEMKQRATGTVQRRKRVSPDALLSIPLTLPSLAEQGRVVDIIGAADSVIAAARSLVASAATLLLSHLDGLHSDETRRLGDLVDLSSGPSWKSEQEHPEAVPESRPVIGITNTTPDGRLDLTNRRFVVGLSPKVRALTEHSLILIRTNGNRDRIGNVYRSTPEAAGSAVSAFQIMVEPSSPDDSAFLYWVLGRPTIQRMISMAASGSTGLGNIGVGWLKDLQIPWPRHDDRAAFVTLAEALSDVRRRAEEVLASHAALRRSLLGELLSGEHRLPPSYDDAVEVA